MKLKRYIQIEERRHAAYEKKFTALIRKALMSQGEAFIKTKELNNSMFDVLSDVYEIVMKDYLNRQWQQLEANNIKKETNFFLDTWAKWLKDFTGKELTNKVTNIDETTRELLRTQVVEGAKLGETVTAINARIRKTMTASTQRARMIARTEVGEAVNKAKTKSSDDWETETGTKLGKLWIHRGAKDPRDWHMSLDTGIAIPKDDYFTVTNSQTGESDRMMYPHDSSASAGNVINCGCQIIYTRLKT